MLPALTTLLLLLHLPQVLVRGSTPWFPRCPLTLGRVSCICHQRRPSRQSSQQQQQPSSKASRSSCANTITGTGGARTGDELRWAAPHLAIVSKGIEREGGCGCACRGILLVSSAGKLAWGGENYSHAWVHCSTPESTVFGSEAWPPYQVCHAASLLSLLRTD